MKAIITDITKLNVDVIVNAANTSLLGGGGLDGAIHRAAGPKLLEECKTLNGCDTGNAKITKAYNLPAKYIIHTVGPVWHGGKNNEAKLLTNCYINSLKLAQQLDAHSIAFPAISCGVYRFPLEQAAKIATRIAQKFLKDKNGSMAIIFACFNQKTKEIYDQFL